jgi:hypothetical protein
MNLHHAAPERAWTSRLYETETDLLQMQDVLMEARAHTNDWRHAHVGELNFAFFYESVGFKIVNQYLDYVK